MLLSLGHQQQSIFPTMILPPEVSFFFFVFACFLVMRSAGHDAIMVMQYLNRPTPSGTLVLNGFPERSETSLAGDLISYTLKNFFVVSANKETRNKKQTNKQTHKQTNRQKTKQNKTNPRKQRNKQ